MSKQTKILLVEDDEGHARLVRKAFSEGKKHFYMEIAANLKEARDYLAKNQPDIILADLILPDGRGIDLLLPKPDEFPFPLVVLTSQGDETVAVEAIKAGAMDYIVKSADTIRAMPHVVQRTMREWEHIVRRRQAEEKLKKINDQLIEANRKLEHLANIDSLTGVANRRNFMETLEKEWKRAQRTKLPLSLIMIDVDFFKAYNDNYGHQAGDECLKNIAALLNDSLARTGDVVARYGGEEFMAILPGTDLKGTAAVAERLRKIIEDAQMPHQVSNISDYVTVSLGTATIIPGGKESTDTLIAAADNALYKAKKNGRNRFEMA
jgi:two-component system chemotaxis family response regulator WspR